MCHVEYLRKVWQEAPHVQFLSLPEHELPTVPPPIPNRMENCKGNLKDYKVCTVKRKILPLQSISQNSRETKWRRLVRLTAYVFGFVRNLKARVKKGTLEAQ